MPLPSKQIGDDPDQDTKDICRLLESGKNVVTTVGFVYPKAYGAEVVARLEAACATGQSSIHGTGVNPGFMAELVPLTLSSLSRASTASWCGSRRSSPATRRPRSSSG